MVTYVRNPCRQWRYGSTRGRDFINSGPPASPSPAACPSQFQHNSKDGSNFVFNLSKAYALHVHAVYIMHIIHFLGAGWSWIINWDATPVGSWVWYSTWVWKNSNQQIMPYRNWVWKNSNHQIIPSFQMMSKFSKWKEIKLCTWSSSATVEGCYTLEYTSICKVKFDLQMQTESTRGSKASCTAHCPFYDFSHCSVQRYSGPRIELNWIEYKYSRVNFVRAFNLIQNRSFSLLT